VDSSVLEKLLSSALSLHGHGDLALAERQYTEILSAAPDHPDALHYLGLLRLQHGDLTGAVAHIERSVLIRPNDSDSICNLALCLNLAGRHSHAFEVCQGALANDQLNDKIWTHLGNAQRALGMLSDAEASYGRALKIRPNNPRYLYNLANSLSDKGLWKDARRLYSDALALDNSLAEIHLNLAVCLLHLQEPRLSLVHSRKSHELNPDLVDGLVCQADALTKLNSFSEAVDIYDSALRLNPHHPHALRGRGGALFKSGELLSALESYRSALAENPTYADAWCDYGVLLARLRRRAEALYSYEQCTNLAPNHLEGLCNRGVLLTELNRQHEALELYDSCLRLAPQHTQTLVNKGTLLADMRRFKDALICLEAALTISAETDFLLGIIHYTKMKVCDWHDFSSRASLIASKSVEGKAVVSPFAALGFIACPRQQRVITEKFVEKRLNSSGHLVEGKGTDPQGKIKVGYYSADFYSHATMYLMAEIFELHNPDKFEIYAFSFGKHSRDQMSTRLRNAVYRFIDVSDIDDFEVVRISREIGISIAVDLKGHTLQSRPDIFRLRAAPVQVGYLGFPGTTGIPEMDYLICDPIVAPPSSASFYSERIVYLSDCYQVNDSQRPRPRDARNDVLHRHGLPIDKFVFCSFNNNWKITPDMFSLWVAILNAVPESILWIYIDNEEAAVNLHREAINRGLDGNRVFFAHPVTHDLHLARYRGADLFLDTYPCCGHTTASDSLWCGVPVLTLAGESFASRVAMSLLYSIGVPELVSFNQADYVQKVIEIASQPSVHIKLKEKISLGLEESDAFNSRSQTRSLERVFVDLLAQRDRESGWA